MEMTVTSKYTLTSRASMGQRNSNKSQAQTVRLKKKKKFPLRHFVLGYFVIQ